MPTPTEQLGRLTLKTWTEDKLDWAQIEQCRAVGVKRFTDSLAQVMARLDGLILPGECAVRPPPAGGIPKAKVFLAIANRVYKGRGERFMSSQTLLDSDLGKLILMNFDEVSANTFGHLIEGQRGGSAHGSRARAGRCATPPTATTGTEILIGVPPPGRPTPVTQGFARMRLGASRRPVDEGREGDGLQLPNSPTPRHLCRGQLPLVPLLQALHREGGGAWAQAQWRSQLQPAGRWHQHGRPDGQGRRIPRQRSDAPVPQFRRMAVSNAPAQAELTIHFRRGAEDATRTPRPDHRPAQRAGDRGHRTADARRVGGAGRPVLWLNHDIIARQLNRLRLIRGFGFDVGGLGFEPVLGCRPVSRRNIANAGPCMLRSVPARSMACQVRDCTPPRLPGWTGYPMSSAPLDLAQAAARRAALSSGPLGDGMVRWMGCSWVEASGDSD